VLLENTKTAGTPESVEALREMVGSLEPRLVSLYEERERMAFGHLEAVEMVRSLEQPVAALLDEGDDLAAQLTRAREDIGRARRRARAMVDAIVEQAFA
jgi:septation ring formation regulator EzrA